MTTVKNDGGQAFPGVKETGSNGCYSQEPYEGMSLRDWFAGMVLCGLAGHMHQWSAEDKAKRAYKEADAMLKERGE